LSIPVIVISAAVIGAVIEAVILFFLLSMLEQAGAVGKNYRGVDIPLSAGISFPIAVLAVFLIYVFFSWYDNSYHLFMFGIMSISFLGFIDDMLGKRNAMGFKGHFGALFKGKLTTGGLKALGGGLIALFLAHFHSSGTGNIILNALIIALFTNMLNLLDLRPGRAIKGYLFFLLVIVVLAGGRIDWLLIAPLLGAVIYYFIIDLRAGAMMGDAGSNVLGLTLGYLSIINLSLLFRIGILIFLMAMHLYTEKYSLTKTIEKVPLLKAIDKLGRSSE